MSVRFSKPYKNDYGSTQFSTPIELTGNLLSPTEKFNRRTQGIIVDNENQLQLLKEQGIKIYKENLVYIDLNGHDEDDDLGICIKRFKNLKNETFNKLVYSKPFN